MKKLIFILVLAGLSFMYCKECIEKVQDFIKSEVSIKKNKPNNMKNVKVKLECSDTPTVGLKGNQSLMIKLEGKPAKIKIKDFAPTSVAIALKIFEHTLPGVFLFRMNF